MSEPRSFEQIASTLYGKTDEQAAAKRTAPTDSSGVLPPGEQYQALAERFYPPSPLPGVNFNEPAQGSALALASTQRMPVDVIPTAADQAELVEVQKTWHKLGIGISQAEALWSATLDARRHVMTAEEGRSGLARMYGAAAQSKEVDAGRLFSEMRQAWPNAEGWIRRVGNDPRVVAVFAERASRRGR